MFEKKLLRLSEEWNW